MKAALVLFALVATLAGAAEPTPAPVALPDRETLERRLTAVETLIERSSAAKQIESSGDARATTHREKAREIHRMAARALQAGDFEAASRLLPQASIEMFEGVRLAGADAVVAPKRQRDFEARLESAKALAAAQKRIANEKKNDAGMAQTSRTIEDLIGQAERSAAAGDLDNCLLYTSDAADE